MLKFKHIAKVGVELEGAFAPNQVDNESREGRETNGIKGESMQRTPEEQAIITAQGLLVGERNSPPYEDLSRLRRWISTFYPKLNNQYNGFHIHVSFKKDEHRTKIIASKEFHDDFLKAAAEFVTVNKYKFNQDVLGRVVGGMNQYARHEHNPGSRVAIHALSHWRTCEFRLFSGSMNLTQAKKVLTWLVTYVEDYLDDVLTAESLKNVGVSYEPAASAKKVSLNGQDTLSPQLASSRVVLPCPTANSSW